LDVFWGILVIIWVDSSSLIGRVFWRIMKIKTIEFGLTKGLPNFSSIKVSMTADVDEDENLDHAFDKLKQEVEKQCDQDPSWISRD
jgi:hypothetical protein